MLDSLAMARVRDAETAGLLIRNVGVNRWRLGGPVRCELGDGWCARRRDHAGDCRPMPPPVGASNHERKFWFLVLDGALIADERDLDEQRIAREWAL